MCRIAARRRAPLRCWATKCRWASSTSRRNWRTWKPARLRALAVTGSARSTALPNVPTAAEAGVPGLVAESWYGLFAPAGTPPAALAKLASAMEKVMAQPALKAKLGEQGAEITYMGTDAFTTYLSDDRKRLLPLIKAIGLKQG